MADRNATNKLPLHLVTEVYSPEQRLQFIEREYRAALDLMQSQFDKIRDQAETIAQLETVANIDPLTGLFNARYLMREAPSVLAKATRSVDNNPQAGQLIIAYADVNGLKGINDTLGHAAGDRLIERMAIAFKEKCRRRSDHTLIRKSGDEFVLILQKGTVDFIDKVFRDINADTSFAFENHIVDVKCSHGYAVYNGQSFDAMLAEADDHLYRNKNANRGLTTTIRELPVELAPVSAPLTPCPS